MGLEVAKACHRRGIEICKIGLTGPNMPGEVKVDNEVGAVTLLESSKPTTRTTLEGVVKALKKEKKIAIAIDFTHPAAVNPNAELYNAIHLPFVMGTTGGDREALMRTTAEAKNHAVIASNMCKQIVAVQAIFQHMAKQYPGSFEGYELSVTESHQKGKADTSGTAKDVVKSLNAVVGGDKPFAEEQIKKLRTDEESIAFGVPPAHLSGHAHHTYHLESKDGNLVFEFKHNVNGRTPYAEGVADAVKFLASRIDARAKPKIYTMVDVLEAGAM